jgi:ribosome biogenesis GTPase
MLYQKQHALANMTIRKLNKQQKSRIKNKHLAQLSAESASSEALEGLVLAQFRHSVEIEDPEGKRVFCALRQNLPLLVAGDRVLWQWVNAEQGIVMAMHPRHSLLAKEGKPVAANITQLVIVVATQPEISWPLLDSYLIMAQILDLKALILLNKMDLPAQECKNMLLENYASLGYPIIFTQKNNHLGYEDLAKALNNQVSVFVGQSGVGKSSLISGILPKEENIVTGALSTQAFGRHTTSNSRYYHLPLGGALIDSPGVREFVLGKRKASELAGYYPEFKPLITQCKFRNCTHQGGDYCALTQALGQGNISRLRYENFKKLYETNAK